MLIRQSTLMLSVYIAGTVLFFFLLGIAILDEELPYQFYADSVTYERMAAGEHAALAEGDSLISVGANYLGPILLLKLVNDSRVAILALNIAIFVSGFYLLARFVPLKKKVLLAVLFINPMTFSILLSVNKEILGFACICLLLGYLATAQWRWLLPSLVFSIMARWQMTAFIIAVVLAHSPINPARSRPLLTIVLGLAALTVIYPQLSGLLGAISENAASGGVQGNQSGIYLAMVGLQENYGYFLVFIPKTVQAMFGLLARIGNFGDPDDFYNMTVVMLHSVALTGLAMILLLLGRLRLSDPLVYVSLLFCLLFSLSPVYAPRYFYPVYVLWACVLARRSASENGVRAIMAVAQNRNGVTVAPAT